MTDDPRLESLLDELLKTNATPEQVCARYPELLTAVCQRWRKMRLVRAEIELLFPPETALDTAPESLKIEAVLPTIPGYVIEAVLGRGGMGIVYQAQQLRPTRRVALKMLLAGPYAGPNERERFLREAEAVAGLRHPNVVQLYQMGDVDGRPYFTMELLEGGSLEKRVADQPIPALHAAELAAAVADAIGVAHLKGIIHRDLKPANILLTADGTPKVTDFGLARQLDGDALTLSGTAIGTPSYMAPEQARCQTGAIGCATDIYALGAILYECLTGRPPFRAETAAATLQQVISDEPVPPVRLNPRVPRDLETICLNCLHKELHRRYASAAALADDLRRFTRGEPIRARAIAPLERLAFWVRRRPAQASALTLGCLLAVALSGSGLWLYTEHVETVRAAEDDLREETRLEQKADWIGARAALSRARARFLREPMGELRDRLQQASRDLDLVVRLDGIHLKRTAIVEGRIDNLGLAAKDYEVVFREAGLVHGVEAAAVVAERVKASNVRKSILAALDDWALCTPDADKQAWLLEVSRRVDPEIWRDRVRDPAVWPDRLALTDLAQAAPLVEQPVPLLVVLADRLQFAGGDATEFLTRVQHEHPADFHANFALANALRKAEPTKAIGYYRAAIVARPEAATTYYNLGGALRESGQHAEAIQCIRRALALDPRSAWAYSFLGGSLQDTGETEKAIECYRQAIRLDPKLPWAYFGLGTALRSQGTLDEAMECFQKALQLDATLPWTHYALGEVLADQRRGDEAIASYRRALELEPTLAWAHYRLGLCLRSKGEQGEADSHFQLAAQLQPENRTFLNEYRSSLARPAPPE